MESFFRGIIRFRWLVIALVLGCTGLAWVQLQTLRFESDADAMLPPSDPVIGYNDLVEDRFGIRDLIIVGVLNDNSNENGVFNPRTLGIVKEFSEQITVATMAASGKAIFFNALVVIGGFLVLLSSHFRPNFYLGAMMALNMGACLLVSMTVLPAMLNLLRPRFVFGSEHTRLS